MTDSEFMDRAEILLKAVEASCDRINDATTADIDNQRTGGMVTLVFANRSQIVINLQKPLPADTGVPTLSRSPEVEPVMYTLSLPSTATPLASS